MSRSVRFASFFLKCSSSSDESTCCILHALSRACQALFLYAMEHRDQLLNFCSWCD